MNLLKKLKITKNKEAMKLLNHEEGKALFVHRYPGLRENQLSLEKIKKIIKYHFIWLALSIVFNIEYIAFLVMFDMGMIIFFTIHHLIFEPRMIKGKFPSYFRESYSSKEMKMVIFVKQFVYFGAFIRIAALLLMLSVVYSNDLIGLSNEWERRTDNVFAVFIAFTVYVFYMHLIHFKNKYIKVDLFFEKVKVKMEKRNLPSLIAIHETYNELRIPHESKFMIMEGFVNLNKKSPHRKK